jgi:SAM-dependent methyltransferase
MDAAPDWWKDFFSGLVAEFWRKALPPEITQLEADFLQRQLAVPPAAEILDVPCGHGRLAIELALRGFRVTGVDLSEELLGAARKEAEACRVRDRVRWRLSDMRELPAGEDFEASFCAGSSFGFLGDDGDLEFLRAVAAALLPGGRFVLDASKVAESILPAFRERHRIETGGLLFEAENRYDARHGWIQNRYTITRAADGRTETRLARHRVYTVSQLCSMLERADFQVGALFGSTAEDVYRPGCPQLFVVAVRSR